MSYFYAEHTTAATEEYLFNLLSLTMRLQKALIYLLSLLLLLNFTGCDEKSSITPSNTALLTSGTWIGTAVYESGDNMTQQYADQNLDIRKLEVTFSTNGSVSAVYNNGRPDVGTWKFIDDESAIMFQENTPDEQSGEIIELSETDFRIIDHDADLEMHFVKKGD